jgi:hypothetical protein
MMITVISSSVDEDMQHDRKRTHRQRHALPLGISPPLAKKRRFDKKHKIFVRIDNTCSEGHVDKNTNSPLQSTRIIQQSYYPLPKPTKGEDESVMKKTIVNTKFGFSVREDDEWLLERINKSKQESRPEYSIDGEFLNFRLTGLRDLHISRNGETNDEEENDDDDVEDDEDDEDYVMTSDEEEEECADDLILGLHLRDVLQI